MQGEKKKKNFQKQEINHFSPKFSECTAKIAGMRHNPAAAVPNLIFLFFFIGI